MNPHTTATMHRYSIAVRLLTAVCLASGLAACKGRTQPEAPADTAVVAPAPAPPAVASIDLGKSIGADRRVSAAGTSFAPADTIYASVSTTGSAPSVMLAARWTYQDGQVVSQDSQAVALNGPANTEFHISKPDGFPRGNYKVEVTLNGVAMGSRDFSVN